MTDENNYLLCIHIITICFYRRGVQQDATKTNVMSKIKDKTLSEKFRYFEMYDLQQKVRLILQKVDTLSGNVFIPLRRRLMKYKVHYTLFVIWWIGDPYCFIFYIDLQFKAYQFECVYITCSQFACFLFRLYVIDPYSVCNQLTHY